MKKRQFIPRTKNRAVNYKDHPEAATMRVYAGFTPWRVDCVVFQTLLDHEGTKISIFARAPDPTKAMHAARILWGKKVKERNIRPGAEIPEYPRMDDRHDATCIDDQEFAAQWKDAQKWPRVWAGMPQNPVAFMFWPDRKVIITG